MKLPKQPLALLVFVVIFGLVSLISLYTGSSEVDELLSLILIESPSPSFLPSPTPQVAAAQEELVTVTRVIDGDTIELEDGRKVRYIGIDTPETKAPNRPVECFGQQAAEFNRSLVEGQEVRLEKDVSETDRYGRLLRYVYQDDEFINLTLVSQGYAVASSYPPDIAKQEELRVAEAQAREVGAGLWSSCSRDD